MPIAKIMTKDGPRWVNLDKDVSALPAEIPGALTLSDLLNDVVAPVTTGPNAKLLAPLVPGARVICIGLNYRAHAAETGHAEPAHPVVFTRTHDSLVGPDDAMVVPAESERLDYEGELAVVIGKGGRRISQEDAYDHIAALTLCNEGTIRDWVRHAKFNVTQGKNWDSSGAIGPWLVPFTDAAQLDDARIITRVNGEVRQDDTLNRMMFPIRREIEYISTFMTLKPGDIIVTGTPTGAGARFDPPRYLKPGDVVEVEVEGIGVLSNGVEDEAV